MIKILQTDIKESLYFNTYETIKKYLDERKPKIELEKNGEVKISVNEPAHFVENIMIQGLRSHNFPFYIIGHTVEFSKMIKDLVSIILSIYDLVDG